MKINFCKADRLLSVCGADNPEKCKFYKEATYHGRCTYQTIDLGDGEYNCSCLKARDDAKKIESEFLIEIEEGKLPL